MRRLSFFIAFWLVSLAATSATAAPDLPSGKFRRAAVLDAGAPGDLEGDVRSLMGEIVEPAWVAYAMPRIARPPRHEGEAGGHDCGTYYLEERREEYHHGEEEAASFFVLLRVADGEVGRIRAVSTDCEVDAGGLDVHVFSDVDTRQSLDLVVALAESFGGKRFRGEALFAIALHDEPAADPVLERVALGELDWHQENQAVFWLGSTRGRPGFEILRRLAATSDDIELRHQIAFGYHVSHVAESVDALIEMARNDNANKVRRQALFWLAQEASHRAVEEIDRAIEEDPDSQIRKHAVFALSQLPPERGVPLLIRHARSHSDPVVRKQAIFWLGQSGDERALEFFEEVLLN